MFVQVNGARLFFDVEGAGLVPDGTRMREKPTLLLLHGGPGFDHSIYKPAFSAVADLAQVIYLDHRGCGRSSGDNPETWNLAQWGDDVRGFCDALGIERPIVLGTSFGGFVAQAYATRHPDHPAKLVLVSTATKADFPAVFEAFGHIGGPEAKRIAEAHWLARTSATQMDYLRVCFPLYFARPSADRNTLSRGVIRNEVALHFNGPANEHGRMDFRTALGTVRCPVLVLAGERDPITPPAFSEEITRCLPSHLVRFERFPDCGHGVFADVPERAFAILREFLTPMTDGGPISFGLFDGHC
jgi:pimeloyl-ACP methyl ester carboxylesterase